jgi:serine/threonine protein phosphatase PrpC
MRTDRPELDILTFRHPRRSSDFCVAAESGRSGALAGIYGVCDMIGRPRGIWWRRYTGVFEKNVQRALDERPPENVEDASAVLCREMARHSRLAFELRTRHDASAYGYCVCLAAVCGRSCRIHWLGDCRAYLLERAADVEGAAPRARVTVLTRDQNGMQHLLDERASSILFRSEMLELGRQLDCFLGVSDDDLVPRTLEAQDVRVTLDARSCLLMCTDGLYLPLVRARLEERNFDLTADAYYLASWLEEFLSSPPLAGRPWAEAIEALIDASLREGRKRRRYRDDIAVVGVCRPAATVEAPPPAVAAAGLAAGLPEGRSAT